MPSQNRLKLQGRAACLDFQQERLLQIRTLVGLDVGLSEAVLMPSFERLCCWVLNLVCPGKQETLLSAALAASIEGLLGLPDHSNPLVRLAVSLREACDLVFRSLTTLSVSSLSGEHWGFLSSSLLVWGQAMQFTEVVLKESQPVPDSPGRSRVFLGRVVSGATLSHLEHHGPEALSLLLDSGITPCFAHPVEGARRLMQRGIWSADKRPGRIWLKEGEGFLLWPLAVQDLVTELGCRDMEDCLEKLKVARCVEGEVIMEVHPLLQKPVQAIKVGTALNALLRGAGQK